MPKYTISPYLGESLMSTLQLPCRSPIDVCILTIDGKPVFIGVRELQKVMSLRFLVLIFYDVLHAETLACANNMWTTPK